MNEDVDERTGAGEVEQNISTSNDENNAQEHDGEEAPPNDGDANNTGKGKTKEEKIKSFTPVVVIALILSSLFFLGIYEVGGVVSSVTIAISLPALIKIVFNLT